MSTALPPPEAPGHWLTGHLPELRRDILGLYTGLARKHGDLVRFRLGPRSMVLLNGPALIEEVLVGKAKSFIKHYAVRLNSMLLGQGLLTSEGDFWLRQRRLAQPAFLRERLNGYGPVIVEHAERLGTDWREGEKRDLYREMARVTLQVIARVLFDADVERDVPEVGEALEEAQERFIERFRSLLILPDWVPTPGNLRLRRAVRRIDEVVFRLIDERRRLSPEEAARKGDLLSLLLRARDEGGVGMSDTQLRDEAVTLFLAGYDTTALTLGWTAYLLAQNPEVDARLAGELNEVLGGRAPTLADLPRLAYTERVLMEVMRLYPAAYAIGRECREEVVIGGYRLARGESILMCQWVTHRDPRFFPDPEKFDPDRWLPGRQKQLPRFAYYPFGGGPRACIGNHFAMMEAALILASVARRFRFSLEPGTVVRPRPGITLRPDGGIPLRIHRRTEGV